MRRILGGRFAATVLYARLIEAGCATPGPTAPSPAVGTATPPARCTGGILGIEALPISRR
ncbi:MAG TPA: hypothetical protein VK416_04135 [Thermoanaerobaculia bacterium]|nr:hypothetical protein [Thermoanaerobaculia bacterium]